MTEPQAAPASPPPEPAPGLGSPSRGATPGQPPGPQVPVETPNILTQAETAPVGADGLTTAEETELARLQGKAQAAAAQGALVRLKVEEPHESMHYGGITVTRDYTSVPARLVPALETAAAGAGVTLTQEEEEG